MLHWSVSVYPHSTQRNFIPATTILIVRLLFLKPSSTSMHDTAIFHIISFNFICHGIRMKWVPCYHSMVCPQVNDRGGSLKIGKVAVGILNKQLQLTRGSPSSWRLCRGLTVPCFKKLPCYEMFHRALYLDVFFDMTYTRVRM